jgi:hypothetical protein
MSTAVPAWAILARKLVRQFNCRASLTHRFGLRRRRTGSTTMPFRIDQ